jgi:hypothetical protein
MPDISLDARTNLTQALHDAFPTRAKLKLFADQCLGFNIEDLGGDGLVELVHAFVIEMQRTGRLRDLATSAQGEAAGNSLLMAATGNVLKQLDQADALQGYREPEDPFETCFVRPGRPFIDREPLRAKLKMLHIEVAPGLVVTGEPHSGKSYSLRLVVHVASAYGARVADVDLRLWGYDPRGFAESILGTMGRSSRVADLPEAQTPRSVMQIAKFLVDEIRASGETWWIVVDGIDGDTPSDTRDLVWALVLAADNPVDLAMRVVLLDCNELLPHEVDDYVEKEAITPIDTTNARCLLEEFFTRVAAHSGRSDPNFVADKVDEVLNRVPAGPDMLQRLGVAVRRAVQS